MTVTTGPRLGLTRWSVGTDPLRRAQLDADHAAIEAKVALYVQGLAAGRPATGIDGRFYYATDTGALSYDNGTGWTAALVFGNDARLSDARTPLAHTHAAADVNSGVLAPARLGSGAASSSTYLRGDGTWTGLPGGSLSALSDVALTSSATAQVLRYDGAAAKWKNAALAVGDLPVAASGTSSATAVVRADDARLSDARTPTAHTHTAADVNSGTLAIARLPVAASGTSSATQVVRADDARLADARTPTGHAASHASGGSDPITPAAIGAAPAASPTLTGTTTVGGADTDVEKLRAVVLEVDGRSVTLAYNADGTLATVTEKAGATTVKTTTLTYTGGDVTSVAEAAGGNTTTTTLTYTSGTLTGMTRSVA